ncbi:uncharacterized protein LOC108098579 [Drosophila ficusphila]|uniref:uncharacterized protein LOC108098579 n=1 Tax=Drosophila ficusphila TaxID=30025 RepID=UPI0007E670A3|nr:uncharacterized protein LOC108098579 [Drosophila ficusphila]
MKSGRGDDAEIKSVFGQKQTRRRKRAGEKVSHCCHSIIDGRRRHFHFSRLIFINELTNYQATATTITGTKPAIVRRRVAKNFKRKQRFEKLEESFRHLLHNCNKSML